MFGYDLKGFPGRGLMEAVGEGIVFEDSDVLCLAHIASVTWKNGVPILAQKRPDMQEPELKQLFSSLTPREFQGIRFRLCQTRPNDAILVLSGGASPYISDSDPVVPGRAIARIWSISDNPEPKQSEQTSEALNQYLTYCHRVLAEHEVNRGRQARNLPPANFLVTQRCGRRIVQEPFRLRWGMAGMLIASGSVYGGLAYELAIEFVRVKDGPDPGEDLKERVHIALDDVSHDFIHVHTKVPDEAGHTGDPKKKVAAITSLDRGLDELVRAVESRDDLLVVVTADHSTPTISPLIHSGEPVPIVTVGSTVRRDDVYTFDEVSAARGCLGLLQGKELMLTILNYTDRSSLLGHRLGKTERCYVPELYEPFKLTD
jgi:2,3-bisphosphoglycerate-independent phosphoglycerate mutase